MFPSAIALSLLSVHSIGPLSLSWAATAALGACLLVYFRVRRRRVSIGTPPPGLLRSPARSLPLKERSFGLRPPWGIGARVPLHGRSLPLELPIASISTSGVARAVSLDPNNREPPEGEARLRLASLSASDGIYDIDLITGRIYSSSRLLELLGLNRESTQHVSTLASLGRLLHPEDRDAVNAALRDTLERGHPFSVELRIKLCDGNYGWFHARGDVQRDALQRARRLAGFLTDITGRKESELALKRSEASLAEAQTIAKLGSWELDPATLQMSWSKEVFRIFSLDPDSQAPTLEWLREHIHAGDRAAFEHALTQALTKSLPFDLELRCTLQDGSLRVLHGRGRRRPLIPGMPSVIHGTVQDITDRKRIEEDHLRAKEAAEAANRAKGFFLANMSHEIRTPMNGILGLADVALHCQLSPEVREHLSLIKQSGEALLTIVNDILDFSKIEAGKLELEETPFNVHALLTSAMRALSIRTSGKDIEILFSIGDSVPEELIGDPHRFRQVVMNLVGNAIKFTPQGEVELTVDVESEAEQEVELRVTVRDTGIGIPAAVRDTIFDAFVQADASTTRQYGGTGLGLTIVSQLVSLMRGRLWLESEVGRGSTFFFTVRMSRNVRHETEPSEPQTGALAGMSALIVDDNLRSARLLEQYLRRWKMRTQVASSGEAALALLREQRSSSPIQVMLIDNRLLDMLGLEVVWHAQNEGTSPEHAVLMLSPVEPPELASGVISLGMSAHLSKPIAESALLDVLCSLLARPSKHSAELAANVVREKSGVAPLDILIAEDNPVNQRLARLMLERAGHRVTIAQHGGEAVQMYQHHAYDAVLMDVQMPQVDGLSATAAIRQLEARTGHHVPIIAMTAHAMKGDRERCIAHGMDHYVSKPVTKQALNAALSMVPRRSEFAAQRGQSAQTAAQQPLRAEINAELRSSAEKAICESNRKPDVQLVSVTAAAPGRLAVSCMEPLSRADLEQRLGVDSSALVELIECFTEDSTARMDEIARAVHNQNAGSLARYVHTLKGAVAVFSTGETHRACLALEQLCHRQGWSDVPAAVARLRETLRALLDSLRLIKKGYSHEHSDR